MNELKLLRKKRKADNDGNKNAKARACIDLAELYSSQERFEDSIAEYEIVAEIYKDIGKPIEYGCAHRGIGEAYIQLQEYDKALLHQKIYLDIAKEQKSKLEEQRALATIGHIHLTYHLNNLDDPNPNSLDLAYHSFRKSLILCKSLTGINKYEHNDMLARLLANLGVIADCKGDYDKGVELLQKSIVICTNNDLFEQLYRGYSALGALYNHKKMYEEGIQQYNLAFEIAGRLKNKFTLQSETLSSKGDILIKLGDYHSAKKILLKAFKLKDPNSSSRENVKHTLKVVAAICKAEDALLTAPNHNNELKKSLYEKLGDGACRLKNFSSAIKYYRKMLEAAVANKESGLNLSPCYVSLAMTHRDNKEFDKAIEYFRNDYNICKDNPRERISTLLNIADCMVSGNYSISEIDSTYNEALDACRKINNAQMEIKVLLPYISLLRKSNSKQLKVFETRLKEIEDIASETESELIDEQNTPNIGDDISISNITDESDSDCENRPTRKRTKTFVFKKNNKGETPLHVACIKGNFELVKQLLDQGHPVNVRDNCGWLPIHEACIYGHVKIVELLIQKGAFIDDRGGTLCQGITPMHDAALNGHLEVVQILLRKGALSVTKNDNGEIPLHVLKQWRRSRNLSRDESILYDTIMEQLTQDAEKLGLPLHSPANTDNSANATTTTDDSTRMRRKSQVGNLRRNVSFHEDLDVSLSGTSRKMNADTPVQNEYRRVIENLRHPVRNEAENKRKSNDKVSAYTEIADDWLEDDLGTQNKKRKMGTVEGLTNSSNIRRTSSLSFSRHGSSSSIQSVSTSNDDIDIPPNFFESNNNPQLTNIISDDEIEGTSSSSVTRKPKKNRQTSLIDSGFTRHRSFSPTTSTKSANSLSSLTGSDRRNSSGTVDLNNIFNVDPTLSVDVRINEKLYKVPVPASEMHTRTVKWLAEEAAKRYHKRECVKAELELQTKNGAILADEDFIGVLFSAGSTSAEEVHARIVNSKVLPLVERFSEACALENTTPPAELLNVLRETSSSLNLTDLNLRNQNLAPLFKVINKQSHLSSLNISGNFVRDNCFESLCVALPMLENLVELNVSLNQLTSISLQYFSDAFQNAAKPILPKLIKLDFSHNPLRNKSCHSLAVVTRYVKLRTLILRDVDFTADVGADVDLVLDSLTHLDISFNHLDNAQIHRFVSWLKPDIIESLNIASNTNVSEGLLKGVVQRLQSQEGITYTTLKSLNFSRTHAIDTEIFELLRTLGVASQFKSLDLSYNDNITSMSLRRLLHNYKSLEYLNVIGCENILKYFKDCTDHTWSYVQLKELQLSCDFSKYLMEKNYIVDLWKRIYGQKAVVQEMLDYVKLSVVSVGS